MASLAAWIGRKGPLWLVLFAILVHAGLPVGSPLQRTIGSAFSASTSDVSLSPQRKELVVASGQEVDPGSGGEDGGGAAGQAAIQVRWHVAARVAPASVGTRFLYPDPVIAWRLSAFPVRAPPSA